MDDQTYPAATADLANSADPDGLMPEQWAERRRPAAPGELRLMGAVLMDAIGDYRSYGTARTSRGRYLAQLARQWVECRDRSWPYSFECICAVFDLDPAALRRQLARERALGEASPVHLRARRHLVLTGAGPSASNGRGPHDESRPDTAIGTRAVA